MRTRTVLAAIALLVAACAPERGARETPLTGSVVEYGRAPSGGALRGILYRPEGAGPFPVLLYAHGSAPGTLSNEAFEAVAPAFTRRGWAVFAPYRRGQGLSREARMLMTQAAERARVPVLFMQAKNDFDLAPSRVLHAAMRRAGKSAEIRLYPPFGKSARDGHAFPYRGVPLWAGDVHAFLERACRGKREAYSAAIASGGSSAAAASAPAMAATRRAVRSNPGPVVRKSGAR